MDTSRIAALTGVVFAVTFVAAIFVLDGPGHDDSELLLNDFYGGSGGRAQVIVGSYLMALSGLSFLCFAVYFLRVADTGDGDGMRSLGLSTAAVFAVLVLASAAAQSPTYALSIDAFDEPESELTRAVIPHVSYSLLVFGLWAAALFVFVASFLARTSQALPSWLPWTGFAAAGLLLFGVLFMPAFALPLWVLAVSVALMMRSGRMQESPS